MLTILVCSATAAQDTERIQVDQKFLKEHPETIRINTVAKGDVLFPFIHVDADYFQGHAKTWAHIKSKAGQLILDLPLDYNETKDGTMGWAR